MENTIIKLLDSGLECSKSKIKNGMIVLHIHSTKQKLICPYCGHISSRVHSVYQREIQDIPRHEKQTILLLDTRKLYCDYLECTHTTFAERFDFVASNGKKTKRLVDKVLMTSAKLSSVNASSLLKADSVKASKSSICDLLKKNAFPCG